MALLMLAIGRRLQQPAIARHARTLSIGYRFSGRTVVAATAAGALGAAITVRQLLKQPLKEGGHIDGSRAQIALQPQATRVVRVLYHDKAGTPKLARLDERQFTAEAERQLTELEQCRGALLAGGSSTLHRLLDETFAECQGPDRVQAFASWYYAYKTTHELMRVALTAAAATAVDIGVDAKSAREAASEAVAAAVLEKYAANVLRPAQTEPKLRQAFDRAAATVRSDVLHTIGRVHAKALPLLEAHTSHVLDASSRSHDLARLDVDWRYARGTAAGIDRAHERPNPVPSVALLGGGALVGKVVASGAGKVAATAATKAMAGKLAAPFVAKVGATMAPAAASVGAAAGGPVGVVVGAGIGLAIDYALAKGLELMGRADLEKDVAFALRTAQGELRYTMETELRRAVNVLLDDAVQLTAASMEKAVMRAQPVGAPVDEHTAEVQLQVTERKALPLTPAATAPSGQVAIARG